MWLVAVALLAQNTNPVIYVATDGNDSWSGGIRRPNKAGTDGPLRTIQAAALKAPGTLPNVHIEPGHYRIERPLEFTNSTAGIYSADPPGKVYVDGSRRIDGWVVDAKGLWHVRLPDVASGKWNFIQLWVNGQRRFRPRSTGDGYATIAERADPSPQATAKGFDQFFYSPSDLDPSWQRLSNVEVLAIQTWSMARMRIRAIDAAKHICTFTGPSASTADWSAFPRGNRYIVENVREALGKPGEWYLDRPTGDLTYIPKEGETPRNTDVEAPIAESLVRATGSSLWLTGINFEYTNWVTPDVGHDFPQADIDVPAAITCVNGSATVIAGCTVSHTGGYGVEFGAGCQGDTLANSTLSDLGAGGVKIGTTSGNPTASNCTVLNCRIVSGGRLHPAAVGIWIGNSSGNQVTWNEVRDFYYTGISVGWTWGYAPTHSGRNLLQQNVISDIGQHVLSDMGGIYTLGDQTGTRLDGNVIHDVTCFAYGGWGIYPDEGTTNEVIENNIVYRCQSAGFHQHYGKKNLVRNNIFALNGDYEVMRTRAEDHLSFTFDHNIIAWAAGQPIGSNWTGTGFEMKNNLYWHYGGAITAPPQEPSGLVADPLFLAPTHGDFRLKPNSPALKHGFKQIDANLAGPHGPGAPPPVKSAPRAFPDPFAVH